MTKLLDQLIENEIENESSAIRKAAVLSYPLDSQAKAIFKKVRERYLTKRLGSGWKDLPEKVARYNAELQEAEIQIRELISEQFMFWGRQNTISLIEFPVLQPRIAAELTRRGIRFVFANNDAENILTVHVVAEYFYAIPVTLDNVDRVLTYISYCINRPDYAHEEIPEIRRFRNGHYAKIWEQVSSPAEKHDSE